MLYSHDMTQWYNTTSSYDKVPGWLMSFHAVVPLVHDSGNNKLKQCADSGKLQN